MKKTTSASATSSTKQSNLDKKNLKKVAANETAERSTKYRYPEDVNTAEKKKAYRRKSRLERGALLEAVEKAKGADKAKAQAELEKWEKKHYNPTAE